MPKDKVIIFVADNNYIDHVKSISVNCVEQGRYSGDFAVICPTNSEAAAEFRKHGFYVLEQSSQTFFQKFYVFDEYFKQWEKVLYLDCDCVVQDDLERLFSLLDNEPDKIFMDTEDGSTMQTFWRDTKQNEHKEIYDLMRTNYPHVDNQTFNTSLMLFKPEYIDNDVPQKLIEIQEQVREVNSPENLGTDQQLINLLLWHKTKKIANKLICFWGLAEPQNDTDSEYRQYKKGDVPVVIHLSRWYGQWIKKTPDADAYLNRKLNIPNYDLYHQNLSQFENTFKK